MAKKEKLSSEPAKRKTPYMSGSPQASALTRLELGLIRVGEGFARWVEELNKFASGESLSYQDIAVLHAIRMLGGAHNLSEILIFLHRHDVSTIHYCLRKLENAELVEKVPGPSKRETSYVLTELGQQATANYAKLRDSLLVSRVSEMGLSDDDINAAAQMIENLIGAYEQSMRALLSQRAIRNVDKEDLPD